MALSEFQAEHQHLYEPVDQHECHWKGEWEQGVRVSMLCILQGVNEPTPGPGIGWDLHYTIQQLPASSSEEIERNVVLDMAPFLGRHMR